MLLDVDGVVNAVDPGDQSCWSDWQQLRYGVGGARWSIIYSRTVVATIARLHHSGLAEVRWLTTWEDEAVALGRHLDIPRFQVAGRRSRFDDPKAWWKLAHARTTWDEGRPLAWADDDLDYDDEARAWLASLPTEDVLVVCPDTDHGLTSDHLVEIESFCRRHIGA